jgi:hypothetical protein
MRRGRETGMGMEMGGHVGTPAARWRRIHASRAKGRDARLVNAAAAELRAQRLEESHSNPL